MEELFVPRRYLSDCELIGNGAYKPLKGFMGKEEVESVLEDMRLLDGTIWSIPIVLPVDERPRSDVLVLKDTDGRRVAKVYVEDVYTMDKSLFCEKVFKTTEPNHPGVKAFMEAGEFFVSGKVELLERPVREEGISPKYYLDPEETKRIFKERGWRTVVAFQTRNPIHRAHEYLIKCALEGLDGVLIHPIVGETKPDDIPAVVRMRCYEVLIENYFNENRVLLAVLPMAMRYAGPREAVHHAIVRKNYGCTHIIIGRDHAGVGNYYGTYEAQDLVRKYAREIGIEPICFENAFYCKRCGSMATSKTCPHGDEDRVQLSGTKVREMLKRGEELPPEFSRKEVSEVLVSWARKG